MTPLSWVALGISIGVLLTAGVAWYQTNLIKQEVDHLRDTLNTWQDEAAINHKVMERQAAICEQLVALTHELLPDTQDVSDPEESLRHLHRVISKQGAANREFRERFGAVTKKLEELKKVLQTTEDTRVSTEERARKAEEKLATYLNGTGDQELRAHVAMVSAERDALKTRVRDLKDALRKTG